MKIFLQARLRFWKLTFWAGRVNQDFPDVTLACKHSKTLQAHRVILLESSTVSEERRRMEVEMDTEVEEPPDPSTRGSVFEYFNRKMKIET